jgi:hypothetical protein
MTRILILLASLLVEPILADGGPLFLSGEWQVDHQIELSKSDEDSSSVIVDGDLNSISSQTQASYVQWAITKYPERHVALAVSTNGAFGSGFGPNPSSAASWAIKWCKKYSNQKKCRIADINLTRISGKLVKKYFGGDLPKRVETDGNSNELAPYTLIVDIKQEGNSVVSTEVWERVTLNSIKCSLGHPMTVTGIVEGNSFKGTIRSEILEGRFQMSGNHDRLSGTYTSRWSEGLCAGEMAGTVTARKLVREDAPEGASK